MHSTHERLAELRAEITTLRWQISTLARSDSRRIALYRALLTRYHESFILHWQLLKQRSTE
jgi:hypothetical protein